MNVRLDALMHLSAAAEPGPATTALDDAELCKRSSRGDDAAFSELCKRHTPALLRMVRSMGLNAEDASDVVQEALCRVLEKRHFLATVTRVRAWLYRVAINIAHSRGRREARRSVLLQQHETEAPGMSVPSVAERDDGQWARMSKAMETLSPRQREVVALRIGNLSFAEVARAIGSTEGACKVHFHNAVKRLRTTLEEVP